MEKYNKYDKLLKIYKIQYFENQFYLSNYFNSNIHVKIQEIR